MWRGIGIKSGRMMSVRCIIIGRSRRLRRFISSSVVMYLFLIGLLTSWITSPISKSGSPRWKVFRVWGYSRHKKPRCIMRSIDMIRAREWIMCLFAIILTFLIRIIMATNLKKCTFSTINQSSLLSPKSTLEFHLLWPKSSISYGNFTKTMTSCN